VDNSGAGPLGRRAAPYPDFLDRKGGRFVMGYRFTESLPTTYLVHTEVRRQSSDSYKQGAAYGQFLDRLSYPAVDSVAALLPVHTIGGERSILLP
jgi:hypothetical protein